MGPSSGEITVLLSQMRQGTNPDAVDRLMALVYEELRRIAGAYMRRERPGHTLQPTGLVHEAYVRLVQGGDPDWQNRAHFMGFAALVMRRVLVEHARSRGSLKRGGEMTRVEAADFERIAAVDAEASELLDIDSALQRLGEMDERLSRTVELRYFGGLSVEETAEVMGTSSKTVQRDWVIARGWLRTELGRGGYGSGEALAEG